MNIMSTFDNTTEPVLSLVASCPHCPGDIPALSIMKIHMST